MLTVDRCAVRLLDGSTIVGAVDRFTELVYTHEDVGTGAWSLDVPVTPDNEEDLAAWVAADAYPGIEIYNPANDWRRAGYLKQLAISEDRDGLRLRAAGFDWMGLLEERLVWPTGSLAVADWWRYEDDLAVGPPKQIANAWVQQILQGARDVPISKGVVNPVVTGASIDIPGKGLPTLQRLRDMMTGTDYTVLLDVEPTGSARRTLRGVFRATDRPTAATRLSVSAGTVGRVEIVRRAATGTRVFGIGAETTAPAREVADQSVPSTGWQTSYIERFISDPGLSGQALIDECQRELRRLAPTESIVATDPVAGSWGQDLDVGWLVEVAVPKLNRVDGSAGEFVQMPVVASTYTHNADGVERTVELGAADRRGLAGLVRAVGDIQRALDREART